MTAVKHAIGFALLTAVVFVTLGMFAEGVIFIAPRVLLMSSLFYATILYILYIAGRLVWAVIRRLER